MEKLFEASEVTINHAEGSKDGPPLVMLHSGPANWLGEIDLSPIVHCTNLHELGLSKNL